MFYLFKYILLILAMFFFTSCNEKIAYSGKIINDTTFDYNILNNKNAVITRDFSALPELVKDIGILIPQELEDEKLIKFCVKKTIELYNDEEKLFKMQDELYYKSLTYDWSSIGDKLINIIENQ